ncbi:hypothetical protein AVEN_267635-1 [Araneus ventricosus]|uniref:DNA-directed RNA polymerase n=1 Tax=Araneus ventricosus TaxID=182803 RepID=A0A4Y2PJI8_ARAVE|nr:hypothetical protein AVEN_267635-1 [Araneus ventricosus]
MSDTSYSFSLLSLEQCPIIYTDIEITTLTKAWRKYHGFHKACKRCCQPLVFQAVPYTHCCGQFYFDESVECYPVQFIAVETPGYEFLPDQLKRKLDQCDIKYNQQFLVIPDPIYWQVDITLIIDKIMKYINGLPISNRSNAILPASKSPFFYKQCQGSPLNYGSLNLRSCGKNTLIRKIGFGKRCKFSLRGLIVADGNLGADEIRIPHSIVCKFGLKGKYVVVIRMPSLGPGNTIALKVVDDAEWTYPCFGFPMERTESLNADFDGDEVNIYLVMNHQSQAECMALLSAQADMSDPVMGLKLAPSQDMLVAYYLYFDTIDFLPYKHRDLKRTFYVLFDLFGSEKTFQFFEQMRKFYLYALQKKTCFALSLEEMLELEHHAKISYKHFQQHVKSSRKALAVQIESGAKGSIEHAFQMFGSIGYQNGTCINHSFWEGLTPSEAVEHAFEANQGMSNASNIWQPGYSYSKLVYSLQGLIIDYWGRIVDGEKVIQMDALSVCHHSEIMSEDTMKFLVEQMTKGKLNELANQLLPQDLIKML